MSNLKLRLSFIHSGSIIDKHKIHCSLTVAGILPKEHSPYIIVQNRLDIHHIYTYYTHDVIEVIWVYDDCYPSGSVSFATTEEVCHSFRRTTEKNLASQAEAGNRGAGCTAGGYGHNIASQILPGEICPQGGSGDLLQPPELL
jgi:hypothetical protein